MKEKHFVILRRHMVELIGIFTERASDELGKAALDERVMAAMARVPRHIFVQRELAPYAYENTPLPISAKRFLSHSLSPS